MSVMSNNDIEGDPLQFLRVSEAYWQVGSVMEVSASMKPVTRRFVVCMSRKVWRSFLNDFSLSLFPGHEVGSCKEGSCGHPGAAQEVAAGHRL